MSGNTTWVNWPKVISQIDAANGVERAPLGPHRMRPGSTYTICGNITDARPSRTARDRPAVSFWLQRKAMGAPDEPLFCVAFAGVAEHLAEHVRRYGIDNPIRLIGQYQLDEAKGAYRFLVSRSGLPSLQQALYEAARVGERFEHCG